MAKFKITAACVVIADNVHEAIGEWVQYPLENVVEMTVAEVSAAAQPEQPKTMAQKVVATTTALVKDAAAQAGIVEKTPICPEHQKPMRSGKYGWYCPNKRDDGSYCRAKAR